MEDIISVVIYHEYFDLDVYYVYVFSAVQAVVIFLQFSQCCTIISISELNHRSQIVSCYVYCPFNVKSEFIIISPYSLDGI